MKISSSSLLVKWAYLGEGVYGTTRTDVCSLFWRCVLLTPIKLLVPSALVGIILAVLYKTIQNGGLTPFLTVLGIFIGAFISLVGIGKGIVIAHKISKEKGFCRIVEIEGWKS